MKVLRIERDGQPPMVLVPAWLAAAWIVQRPSGWAVVAQPVMGPEFSIAYFRGFSPSGQAWAIEQAESLLATIAEAIEGETQP